MRVSKLVWVCETNGTYAKTTRNTFRACLRSLRLLLELGWNLAAVTQAPHPQPKRIGHVAHCAEETEKRSYGKTCWNSSVPSISSITEIITLCATFH